MWPFSKKWWPFLNPEEQKKGRKKIYYMALNKKGLQFFHFLAHLPQKVGDPWCIVYTMHLSRRYESTPKLKPHHVIRTCSLLVQLITRYKNFKTFIIPFIFDMTIYTRGRQPFVVGGPKILTALLLDDNIN